jgi:hypothetical protein
MNLTRRNLAAAGALALAAPSLIQSAAAAAADETAVKEGVEALRQATIAKDKAKFDALFADQLSYSHSDGRVEDKAKVIEGMMGRKSTIKSLEWPELTVAIVGNNGIVRHLYVSESELDGKTTNTKIGVLQVWQKQDAGWKLLARAGIRLGAA